MKLQDIQRETCLVKTESLMTSINVLLKDLGEDMRNNQLAPCLKCKIGMSSEKCEDIHNYLQGTYENLRVLKSTLTYLFGEL